MRSITKEESSTFAIAFEPRHAAKEVAVAPSPLPPEEEEDLHSFHRSARVQAQSLKRFPDTAPLPTRATNADALARWAPAREPVKLIDRDPP
jgi:hypothetical protein